MTMVERVARAIASEAICGTFRKDEYQIAARAAIAAMREPSEEMLARSGEMDGYVGIDGHADRDHIEWWKAMIDAALSE